jgi:hypothetical protein
LKLSQPQQTPQGVWSEKKGLEKPNYMHNNAVKRGLVAQPADWL